jgi:hypothetical protein
MYQDNFIPESVADFYVQKGKGPIIPPISFTMQVIATDVPPDHPDYKIKILLDFAPEFTTERNRDSPNFSGNRVRNILNFVANKIIPKVLEFVYYDVNNGAKETSYQYVKGKKPDVPPPPGYDDVMKIYQNRRNAPKPSKAGKGSKPIDDQESVIEEHLEGLMSRATPLWHRESTVSRVTYSSLSAPKMTVAQATAVNGDKKLPTLPPPGSK